MRRQFEESRQYDSDGENREIRVVDSDMETEVGEIDRSVDLPVPDLQESDSDDDDHSVAEYVSSSEESDEDAGISRGQCGGPLARAILIEYAEPIAAVLNAVQQQQLIGEETPSTSNGVTEPGMSNVRTTGVSRTRPFAAPLLASLGSGEEDQLRRPTRGEVLRAFYTERIDEDVEVANAGDTSSLPFFNENLLDFRINESEYIFFFYFFQYLFCLFICFSSFFFQSDSSRGK